MLFAALQHSTFGGCALTMSPRLILFTRYPVPGEAKTRLIPAIGAEGAALVHKRLTEQTVATLRASGEQVEIAYTGAEVDQFAAWLGGELTYRAQVEGDLTAKLLAMMEPCPCIFFGADTPGLTARHVEAAILALAEQDAVIGPAEDGGYYLVGMAAPMPFLLTDMTWSTEDVFPETIKRLEARGLRYAVLETLSDVDRPEDLKAWPGLVG
jgi:uncharacterized protein